MSVDIWITNSFARELKKQKKANYPIHLITKCLGYIVNNNEDKRKQIKDHQLKGQWKNYREFHPARISNESGKQFDQWIVIYLREGSKLKLTLVATGDHTILHKINPNKAIRASKLLTKIEINHNS